MGSVGMRIASSNSRSSSLSSGSNRCVVLSQRCGQLDRQLAIFATAVHQLDDLKSVPRNAICEPIAADPTPDVRSRTYPSRFLRVLYHARAVRSRPAGPDLPIARYYHHDLYIVSCPAHHPAVIRFLMLGRQVRSPRDVDHSVNDLLVVPARRELGLAGNARAMAMAAATARLAIEYVGGPFRGDVDVLGLRPVLGINRIPPRTIPRRPPHRHHQPSYSQRRPGAPRSTPRGCATRAAPAASREHRHPAPAARAGKSPKSPKSSGRSNAISPPAHYVF